jgi:hypothetical protein
MAVLMYIPPTVYKGSFFSTSSTVFVIFGFLIIAILTAGRWYLIALICCFFLRDRNIEHFVMYFVGHLYFFFWEVSVQIICPFLNSSLVFSLLSFLSSFYILNIKPLSDESLAIFPPLGSVISSSVDCFFCCAEAS